MREDGAVLGEVAMLVVAVALSAQHEVEFLPAPSQAANSCSSRSASSDRAGTR